MGRGGVHGLTTGHLDDVGFINIQPVIKATGIERSEEPERERKIAKKREQENRREGPEKGGKKKNYIKVVRLDAFLRSRSL